MLALIVSLNCAAPRTTSAVRNACWVSSPITTSTVPQASVTRTMTAVAFTLSRFHHCTRNTAGPVARWSGG